MYNNLGFNFNDILNLPMSEEMAERVRLAILSFRFHEFYGNENHMRMEYNTICDIVDEFLLNSDNNEDNS